MPGYTCAHYAAEVWQALTGQDIEGVLVGFFNERVDGVPLPHPIAQFRRIPRPIDPCLVLLRRGKVGTHIGVYLRGRVQHLGGLAPIRQPLNVVSLGYTSVRFYAPR